MPNSELPPLSSNRAPPSLDNGAGVTLRNDPVEK